jgi:hypothetical protein
MMIPLISPEMIRLVKLHFDRYGAENTVSFFPLTIRTLVEQYGKDAPEWALELKKELGKNQ